MGRVAVGIKGMPCGGFEALKVIDICNKGGRLLESRGVVWEGVTMGVRRCGLGGGGYRSEEEQCGWGVHDSENDKYVIREGGRVSIRMHCVCEGGSW